MVSNSIGRKNFIIANATRYAASKSDFAAMCNNSEPAGNIVFAAIMHAAAIAIFTTRFHSYRIGNKRLVNAKVNAAMRKYALTEAMAEPIPPIEGTR